MHYGPVADYLEVGIDDITTDDQCQQWPELDERVVEHYRELMAEGVAFPPVSAVQDDDGNLWLWDGFKRYEACRRAGHQIVLVDVTPGTRRDAILKSVGANAAHGQPRSPEAVKRAIYTLLDDPEWSALSGREIAKHVGVSHTTVQRWHGRYVEERGLAPKPTPKPKATPTPANPTPTGTAEPPDRCIPDADPEPGDDWSEAGEVETPEQKKQREWEETLARCATVLDQLPPEAAEAFENELAFQEDIRSLVKLLLDKYRQWGGRKRTGPFSRRVAWLAECPGLEHALVCLECGGSGRVGSERCPSCKGAGYHLRG
jgi:hypothetical protein